MDVVRMTRGGDFGMDVVRMTGRPGTGRKSCSPMDSVHSLDGRLDVTVVEGVRNKDDLALANGCHYNEG